LTAQAPLGLWRYSLSLALALGLAHDSVALTVEGSGRFNGITSLGPCLARTMPLNVVISAAAALDDRRERLGRLRIVALIRARTARLRALGLPFIVSPGACLQVVKTTHGMGYRPLASGT
jgi:hypothetical protein